MMSGFSSRATTFNAMPDTSAMRANTGSPRNTSGHHASAIARIFAGPEGRAAAALKNATSSSVSRTVW